MAKHVLLLFQLLMVALVIPRSAVSISPEAYWKLKLPYTPMPESIHQSLAAEALSETGEGLDSNNPKYLSYDNDGLVSTNAYGGLLAYDKTSPQVNNPELKQGLVHVHSNGYGGLLAYDKKVPNFENSIKKQGLTTSNGYGGLLAYDKKGPHFDNPNLKQGLVTTNSYGGLLAYDKKVPNFDNSILKQGLATSFGQYDGLLSYDKKGPLFSNRKFKLEVESTEKQKDDNSPPKDQFFFVEKDLHLETKMTLHFQKSTRKGIFLPREVSDQIPFSSDKVEETLKILSLDPESKEAYILSKRIELCEQPTIEGVEKQCVTSLESMVDYVISKIGTDVKALTTQVEKDSKIEYTIKNVQKLVKDDHETVVCHKIGYPYAVFFCHRTKTIRSYMVTLVGEDGSKIEAVAACHMESNAFLDNYAKNVLKIVPGSTHICHFPPAEDTLIWVPKL